MLLALSKKTESVLVMQDVAEFTTTCERYVGTESGGMDQAISMMGMPQIAKLIEYNPMSPSSVASVLKYVPA